MDKCLFNGGVVCDCQTCKNCGWLPSVDIERKERIAAGDLRHSPYKGKYLYIGGKKNDNA